MDKPVSTSVKDFLIRKMMVDLAIPQSTISLVIDHQFSGALQAMQKNDSVEISGFGKFLFKTPIAYKYLKNLEKMFDLCSKELENGPTEERAKTLKRILGTLSGSIELVQKRLDEKSKLGTCNRGMEESSDS